MVDSMSVTKTEWLSLRLHSEEIYNLVSKLEWVAGISSEAQLVLELDSECISMRTLILQLRGQILARPEETMVRELHT